ncbi:MULTISPECIES: YlaF family protein [Bacillaceae]|uniref:FtsH-binding integral membrane protein n=1 Tax=Peribacillus huizhouensis TaxID=1501239 RepID=A0ABR6CJX9_9BACI|nr:FtsH-binding integral membrane protein [Peribacillus huizhouensis]
MNIKWNFLVLALLAVICISGIGIAIAEKSITIAAICVIALTVIMGYGFTQKKKLREQGKL